MDDIKNNISNEQLLTELKRKQQNEYKNILDEQIKEKSILIPKRKVSGSMENNEYSNLVMPELCKYIIKNREGKSNSSYGIFSRP